MLTFALDALIAAADSITVTDVTPFDASIALDASAELLIFEYFKSESWTGRS